MSRGKSLLKNTGILLVAKISTQIVNFLLIPLYTARLTTAEYGSIDIYTSLTMIIMPFLTLQIETALFRYFIVCKDKNEQCEIISSAYFIVVIMLIIFSVFYVNLVGIFHLNYAGLVYSYYLAIMLSTVMLQTCRTRGDNVGYGIGSFLGSSLAVVLNVVFIVNLNWKVEGILISSILAQLSSSFFMLYRTKIYCFMGLKYVKVKQCKALLKYSLPLICNQIASWIINYSDRLLILFFWGESANGIYSVANKFSSITNTFFGVYNLAWTENIVRNMDAVDRNRYVSHVFELTFNLYLILVTGIINFLPFIFDLLVNFAFGDAYQHVPILLIALLFSGMAAMLGSVYIAYNRTKEVSVTTMFAGICNLVVHALLLYRFKLFAASISTLVSFAALFIYRYIYIRKFIYLRFRVRMIVFQGLILLLAWIAYSLRNPTLILIDFAMNIGCLAVFYKENNHFLKTLVGKRNY